jgi:hypothetical protein
MAAAIEAGRQPYVGARFALHVSELTLACHGVLRGVDGAYLPTTDFEPPEPLPWAR